MVACAHLLVLVRFFVCAGLQSTACVCRVLQCLTQVILLIVDMHETGGHMSVLCLCGRVTSSCCQGPWAFIEYLQPQQNTKVNILGGQKVTSIFLCAPAGELIKGEF